MKNTFKFLGIAVLVAAIGFSMTACDTGSTSVRNDLPPAGDGSISAGDWPLIFTGVVDRDGNPVPAGTNMDFTHIWVFSEGDDYDSLSMELSELSLVIPGSEIRLEGDTLSLRLGTPREELLMPVYGFPGGISATTGLRVFSTIWDGDAFYTTDGYYPYYLIWMDPDAYGFAVVIFMYANIAGTIRGIVVFQDEYYGRSEVLTYNVELRPGWNTVIGTGGPDPIVSDRWNMTLVTGRPGDEFVWILREPGN